MKREHILNVLTEHSREIRERFAVKNLLIFGSVARNESNDTSDVDILVDFEGKATFDGYMNLKYYLEDSLGIKVDLVTRKALRSRMRPIIEREAIHVT